MGADVSGYSSDGTAVDLDALRTERYVLSPDLVVAARGADVVQLGTEPARRVLVHGLPTDAARALRRLRTPLPLGDASALVDHPGWGALIDRLVDAGFLVRADERATTSATDSRSPYFAERLALTHQYGPGQAARLLARRADAVVVIEGSCPTAAEVSSLLSASGIGRIYQPVRYGSRAATRRDDPPDQRLRRSPAEQVPDPSRAPAVVRQRTRDVVLHHYPPSHTPPDFVVVVSHALSDRGRAATLVASMVPHLHVYTGNPRGVVGPLVVPGRSACLNCLDLHRTDRDPHWLAVAGASRYAPATPAMTQSVAILAVRQALDWLDGMRRPAAVDATLEYDSGRLGPARRRWQAHPRCGCRLLGSN